MPVRPAPYVMLLALTLSGAAEAGARPLTWPAKTSLVAAESAPETLSEPIYVSPPVMAATTPPPTPVALGAPPSPYGQVGDPFLHRLNPRPEARLPQPARREAVQPASFTPPPERHRPSVIMPPLAPAPALPLDMPAPPPRETPQAAPQRSGVYQIPPGSKYYKGPRADLAAPPTSKTNPADQPFVPGELATDPRTQSARVYSLHRQYGLTPDAISSVSDNAPPPAPYSPPPTLPQSPPK